MNKVIRQKSDVGWMDIRTTPSRTRRKMVELTVQKEDGVVGRVTDWLFTSD